MYENLPPTGPQTAPPRDYYRERIDALGLTPVEASQYGVSRSDSGDVLLTAYHYSGRPVEFIPKHRQQPFSNLQARKSVGEVHEDSYYQQYARTRLHPDRLAKWQHDYETGKAQRAPGKYLAPAGERAPAFPMPAARAAYQAGITGGVMAFVEGEFKGVALDRVGVETVAFTGLTLYRLDWATRDYITRRRPDTILVLYDGDALHVRRDKTTGRITSHRPQAFYNSARGFAGQLFDLLAEMNHGAKVYWCSVNPSQPAKGADDLLAASAAPLAAARELATATTGANWVFRSLTPASFEKTLRATFALDDPASFYQAHAAEIGQDPFTWWGLDYQHREGGLVMLSDPYAVNVPTHSLTVQKWLSEVSEAIEAQLAATGCLAIQSDTGTGKTTYFIDRAMKTGRPLLLVVPTRSICRQQAKYPDAYLCYGSNTPERAVDAAAATVVIATYDTAHHVPDIDRRTLVIDEAHDLVNHYNFRATALNRLQRVIADAAEVVYLSGTMPRALLKAYDVPLVNVTRINSPRVRLHYLKAANSKNKALSEALLSQLAEDLKGDPSRVHFALYNSTKQLQRVRRELLRAGHLKRDEIQVFSRDHYDRGETSAFDELEQRERIREGVRLVLSTSIISEGVNIQNTNVGRVYAVGVMCPDVVRQFTARFRSMATTDLFLILKPTSAPGANFSRDAEGELAYLTAQAQLAATEATRLTKTTHGGEDVTRSEILPHIMPDAAGEGYTVDTLAILADIRRRMLDNAPPAYLLARLLAFDGFSLHTQADAQLSSEAVEGLKAATDADKEAQLATLDTLRGELAQRPEVAMAALYRHYQATRDSKAARRLKHLAADALARVPEVDALEWRAANMGLLNDKGGRELIRRAAQVHFAGVADPVPWLELSAGEWAQEWKQALAAYGLTVVKDPQQARQLPAGLRLDLKAKQLIGERIEAQLAANGPTVSDAELLKQIREVFTIVDMRTGAHRALCLIHLTKGRAVQLAKELYQVSTTRHGTRKMLSFGERHGQLSTGPDFVSICTAFAANPLKIKGLREVD